MNLFKVFASGKKGFAEEHASAILAWFLNPRMEHGLGYSFLCAFLQELKIKDQAIDSLIDRLTSRLRMHADTEPQISMYLEYNVDNAFIDVLLAVDDWLISIENKVLASSASDEQQLSKQYRGLRYEYPDRRIVMVFLVPVVGDSPLDVRVQAEYDALAIDEGHKKVLCAWQPSPSEEMPSFSRVIDTILREETEGSIDPVPEYTRHTLKALKAFILGEFSGYDYQRLSTSSGGQNPLTEGRLDLRALAQQEGGYVGVQGGLAGLMRMETAKLERYPFQFTRSEMSGKKNWIPLPLFRNVSAWLVTGERREINWDGVFPAEPLFRIARDYGDGVYIGIRGGASGLERMDRAQIDEKRWAISTRSGGGNWVPGTRFADVLVGKGFGATAG